MKDAIGALLFFLGNTYADGGMAYLGETDQNGRVQWDPGHKSAEVQSAQAAGTIAVHDLYSNGFVEAPFLDYELAKLRYRYPSSTAHMNGAVVEALTFPNTPTENLGQVFCAIPKEQLLPTHTKADIIGLEDVLWIMNAVPVPASPIEIAQVTQQGQATPSQSTRFMALAAAALNQSTANPKYTLPAAARNVWRGKLTSVDTGLSTEATTNWHPSCFPPLTGIV